MPTATASIAAWRQEKNVGLRAANAYCRTQAFAAAATYHKVDQNDLTGAVSKETSGKCQTGRCDVVAIVCLR